VRCWSETRLNYASIKTKVFESREVAMERGKSSIISSVYKMKFLKLKPSLVLEIKSVRFGLRPNNHLTYIKLIGAHSNLRFQIIKYKNSSKIVKCMINIFIHNNLVS
jgi:hypothetical protein